MIIKTDDYPPGFAAHAQPILNARLRTLKNMSPQEKLICRFILEAFPRLGRGPQFEEIIEGTGLSVEEAAASLGRLNKIDMLKYDEETGSVLVLYPLSGIPCPHTVRMKGKEPVYAM